MKKYLELLQKLKQTCESPDSILSELGDFFPERIVLVRLQADELDGDWEEIGMKRKESKPSIRVSYFYDSKGQKPRDLDVETAGEYLYRKSGDFPEITPDNLKRSFLEKFEMPIESYLTEKLSIDRMLGDYQTKLEAELA